MLGIEGQHERRRDRIQRTHRRIERLAAEAQQTAESTALDQTFRQFLKRPRLSLQRNDDALRIAGRVDGNQCIDLVADHQLLAVADEDVEIADRILDGADLDVLVQFGHQLVAHVEQVVGRLAAGRLGLGDLLIDLSDLGRVQVDLLHFIGNLAIDATGQVAHPAGQEIEAAGQHLGRRQHRLACGSQRGIGGQLLQAGEKILDRRGQPGTGIGQQIIDLRELGSQGVRLRDLTLDGKGLLGQVLVVGPTHGIDVRTAADVARSGLHRDAGRLLDVLAVVSRRVGVRDVVLGHLQTQLGRMDAGDPDRKHAG